MVTGRPYSSLEDVFESADRIWKSLPPLDWKEAFLHHPRIGSLEDLKKKFPDTGSWAGEEQSAVRNAGSDVLHKLKQANEKYEARFGHIFLVCATGKSANEMLEILESRINNPPDLELRIAASEQAKITKLRLEKMFNE